MLTSENENESCHRKGETEIHNQYEVITRTLKGIGGIITILEEEIHQEVRSRLRCAG
jgi:hypothetical protein